VSRAGNPPIDTVGVVDVYAPTSNPYYGLKWREPDGSRRDTSGGKTLEGDQPKATEIDARVNSAAGPLAVTSLEVMVEQFLLEARSPYKTKKPWPNSYKTQIEDQMHRCLRLHEHYRAMDVDRALCDSMRAQGGTPNMVRQNTTALRAFLLWGFQKKYFTATQAELLPRGGSHPAPTILGTEMPARRRQDRHVGQDETFVQDEDAPSAGQVIALRSEFAEARPAWGALAVELGCGPGPRWGEEFQITAYDVHLGGCCRADQAPTKTSKKGKNKKRKKKGEFRPHIHIDWQIDPGANAGDATRAAREEAAALGERQRLARELHDVLAHTLSGLAVQLEGARLLAERTGADPRLAQQVTHAQRLACDGMTSAKRAVATLRGEELPGPAHLPALIEQTRLAGLPVTYTVTGDPRPLPGESGLAVYRMVQEALTNTAKYAGRGASATVTLTWTDTALTAEVTDAGGDRTHAGLPSGGYGLAGLGERAALAGGRLDAGPTADGWRVTLAMPIPAQPLPALRSPGQPIPTSAPDAATAHAQETSA
jgi:signal transduction histidine kinase